MGRWGGGTEMRQALAQAGLGKFTGGNGGMMV